MIPLPFLKQGAVLALAPCCLALLLASPAARAVTIPDPAATGQALVAGVVGKYTSPPVLLPSNGLTDAPVIGNGDLGVTIGGPASALRFYVGKADFWGVLRGAVMPVGNLTLSAPALSGASYALSQNVGPATITGSFANGSSSLALTSWVATSENTAVIQLTNTGSQTLALSSQLLDGFANSAGNPATYGSSTNSTWLNVSPDTVNLELGNQDFNANGNSPFTGAIADLRVYNQALSGPTLYAPETNNAPAPLLRWSASNPGTATTVGGAYINASDAHGGSVTLLDGGATSELNVGDLPLPENQFTFSTWMFATTAGGNGNIITAQIPYNLPYGGTFPYPYVRGLTLKLANGALSASLNQSGGLDFSSYYLTFAADSNNQFATTSSSQVPTLQWVQVAATYDGNILRIFLNGTQVGATASFPTGTTNGTMGWNKMVTHLGDTSVLFNDTAPQGALVQSVLGATATQTSQGNLSFSIPAGGTAYLVLAAVTNRNNANYLTAAQTQSQQATVSSLATLRQTHDSWWSNFWSKSFVQLPDQMIQDSWYGSLYTLACCSTANAPAPGLWGNAVTSTLPNWEGDYTLDYNYQAPFWGAMASNHMELVENYDQPLLDQMSRGRATGQYILGINGIYYYTHLIPAPGWDDDPGSFWGQKSNSLFGAVNCAMRWKYTRDVNYAAKVYPYLKGVADFWNSYLSLQNNQYVDYNDSVAENTGPDTNPATTIAFIQLVYPALVQMSQALNVDQSSQATWNDIIARMSPLNIVPSSSIGSLNSLGAPYNSAGVNVIRNSLSSNTALSAFPNPMVTVYQDHVTRTSSPGMNSTQTIFPGWYIGLESDPATLQAAYNTVWLAAEWFDFNNECTFYPAAANVGYDPNAILSNLDTLITYYRHPNLIIDAGGGGTEQFTIVPSAIDAMFLQSYQTNIHVFPDWPSNKSASFGNLNACGGFLVSSAMVLGQASYVQIQSTAGQALKLANPWPNASVQCVSSINGTSTLSGAVLTRQTQVGEVLTFTSNSIPNLTAPANPGAAANGNSIYLAWSPVASATAYYVKRATSVGGPYSTVATVTSAAGYTDANLPYQTAYYYEISALAPGVESANSTSVTTTTGSAPPLINNNSFESPAVTDGSYYGGVPGWGWLGFGNILDVIVNPGGPSSGEPWPTSTPSGMDGSNFCQLFVSGNGGSGILYQDTGAKYQAGVTYTLTAALGLQTYQTLAPNSTMFLANSSLSTIASKVISASNLTSGAFTSQSVSYTATGNEAAGNGAFGTAGDIFIGFSVPGSAAQSYLDIDNVRLSATSQNIANSGFETPSVSAYQYNPSGGSWTFTAQSGATGSGITTNGSFFTNANSAAPEGTQVAFLESFGTISQQLTGLIPGTTYNLTFSAAQRASQTGESWNVTVNGQVIASYNPGPNATSYTDYTVGFVAPSATPTLSFVGTDLANGDNTVFIDNVRLTVIPKTFANYQQQYFTSTQLQNAAISGASADANGDGISNLMACALGISPLVPAGGSMPVAGTSNGHLTLTYPQPKGLTNWTTIAEVSSDMVNWYSGSAYTTQTSVTSLDANRNQVTVMDNTATSAAAQRYMRLKVTLP
jgi:hypothetical protein